MFNKKLSLIISAALSAVLILSGCGEASETVDETAAETTEKMFTDEELDEMAKNMPEIVFVMSHHYDDTNILGCYVTNTGEMKLYDFRNIAPNEIYEIPNVYDRLEEAVCSEIDFSLYSKDGYLLTENDLPVVAKNKLIEFYNVLLQINGTMTKWESGIKYDDPETPTGHYKYYGAKYDDYGNIQVTLIGGNGEGYSYRCSDLNANDLSSELTYKVYSEMFFAFYESLCGVIYGN